MTYKVKIPKILFLALDIARFYKGDFFNTNDLAELSNRYKKDLVRQRTDKTDYKYLSSVHNSIVILSPKGAKNLNCSDSSSSA